jgi:TetR/AcrR family tetracycline transcriptional repressor
VINASYNRAVPKLPDSNSKAEPVLLRPGRPRTRNGEKAAKVALSPERILKVALSLIDEGGLEAFNIRNLASTLGVFPAAIYWHVPNRDALVSGAIALALEDVTHGLADGPWQHRLSAVLRRFRQALRAHPRLAPAVASELAYNTSFDAALLEYIVATLKLARFEGSALVDAFNVVVAAMCGFATLELSTGPEGAADAWEAACRAQIDKVDPRRYPNLTHHREDLRDRAFLLRWSSGTVRPLDSGFEAWIDVVIRGLESRSRSLRRPATKDK